MSRLEQLSTSSNIRHTAVRSNPIAAIWSCASAEFSQEQPELLSQMTGADPRFVPPAWSKLISYMMEPAVYTLQAGFEASNYSTILGRGPLSLIQSDLLSKLGPGDVFVWVGVANLEWRENRTATTYFVRDVFRSLTARGVLTVFYSTESYLHMTCAAKRSLPVREIWEYTRANELCCPDDPDAARVRYVPPGYHPRKVIAGSRGPDQWALKQSQVLQRPQVPKLVFFGSYNAWYWMRFACLRHVTNTLLSGWGLNEDIGEQCASTLCEKCNATEQPRCPFAPAHSAMDDYHWDGTVANNHFFLNVHKVCDWATNEHDPMSTSNASCESFRLAALLSAGAHVFSERCHPADEQEYGDLVRFVPIQNLSDEVIASWRAADEKKGPGPTLLAAAEERARRFAIRFAPGTIFARAGITDLLAAHRSGRGRHHQHDRAEQRAAILRVLNASSSSSYVRSRFPHVPAFCCLTEAECRIQHQLTHVRVRGNMTKLLEMQEESRNRRRPSKP